VQLGYFEAKSK